MSEYVELFRSEIDERSVRVAFPEMTDSETPIWAGSPSFFSMAGHYFLATLILSQTNCTLHSGSIYDRGEMGQPQNFSKGVIVSVCAMFQSRGLSQALVPFQVLYERVRWFQGKRRPNH